MKTYFLMIIALIAINQKIYSQLSQVFPTDSAYWELDFKCYDGGPFNMYFKTETVIVRGDTIINNDNYAIFGDYYSEGVNPSFVKVIGDQVYFKEQSLLLDTSLYLAFDFGLEVGEAFYYPDFLLYFPDSMIVESIDTVQYLDGISRKRLKLSNPYYNVCGQTDYWVEGIGGMPNPFYFFDCFECLVTAFRFYQNDELVLDEVIVSTQEIAEQSEVIIYPNPAKNYFNINCNNLQIEELRIFDLTGKEVLNMVVSEKDFEVQIPPNIPQGIYLLKLKLDNHSVETKKLVID